MSKSKKIKKQLIDTIASHKRKHALLDAEIARQCGCSQSSICRILKQGVKSPVTIDKILNYVTNLGYKVEMQISKP